MKWVISFVSLYDPISHILVSIHLIVLRDVCFALRGECYTYCRCYLSSLLIVSVEFGVIFSNFDVSEKVLFFFYKCSSLFLITQGAVLSAHLIIMSLLLWKEVFWKA